MPANKRDDHAMGSSAAKAAVRSIAVCLLLTGVGLAAQPERDAPRQPRQQAVVHQQMIVIQPADGDPIVAPQDVVEQLLVQWDRIDDLQAIQDLDNGIVIRGNIQPGGQNRAVWLNNGQLVRQGIGLTRFSPLDRLHREELTAELVLDLLGWSGMSTTHSDEPLELVGWSNDRILEGLNDPDATTRRRVTRALALSDHFDDAQLHDLLRSDDLTLEQRSRLLDVSFARFVVAPRAAVGASFNTGVPIKITELFAGFPAAKENVLRPDDELLEIDGQSLLVPNAFSIVRATVLSRRMGETVPMVIRRPFEPEVVARIRRERLEAQAARQAEAHAEAEARLAEARAQAKSLRDDAQAVWEDDPVWQHVMRQMEALQAKNPDAGMEITPEGDFIFAGQRLGNIAHLDGVFARGHRAIVEDPREQDAIDHEELLTPGENLRVEVPLGRLADLNQGRVGNGPSVADLHNAWRYRLNTLGIDPARITAETVPIRTPELGWIQTNVGQRVTTLISSPRSARQNAESSAAMNLIQRGAGARVGWHQANAVFMDQDTPQQGRTASQDSTAFRVQSTDLAEPEIRLRHHAALNERVFELASLRDRHAALTRRLRSQPVAGGSETLQRELDRLQQRIERIEEQLRLDGRR